LAYQVRKSQVSIDVASKLLQCTYVELVRIIQTWPSLLPGIIIHDGFLKLREIKPMVAEAIPGHLKEAWVREGAAKRYKTLQQCSRCGA
jgi:hypothetical protein